MWIKFLWYSLERHPSNKSKYTNLRNLKFANKISTIDRLMFRKFQKFNTKSKLHDKKHYCRKKRKLTKKCIKFIFGLSSFKWRKRQSRSTIDIEISQRKFTFVSEKNNNESLLLFIFLVCWRWKLYNLYCLIGQLSISWKRSFH